MRVPGLCAVLLTGVVAILAVTDKDFNSLKQTVASMTAQIAQMKKDATTQKNVITSLARQVSQQQLHVEESARSHGDSGLKITRLTRSGSKPYFATSFADARVAAIHDHSNYRGTVGMGELVAVLNGVEFRTRHNDYKMRMPSRTSTKYGATEDIPYPAVPPQVLAKPTLDLQIQEMREWFKAWKNSDYSKRDYRKYFKANLCYLEGQWTNAKEDIIDEPFASDRHAIDAKSFFDLQSKIRYTSVTGRKSTKENYAYLPTTIAEVDEHGNIIYSQWNYQILCHPLKRHVPLTRFRLEEELSSRVANGKKYEDQYKERSARFSLYEDVADTVNPKKKDAYTRSSQGTFLDLLMSEIPGVMYMHRFGSRHKNFAHQTNADRILNQNRKDNYPAKLIDNAFDEIAYEIDANITAKPEPLNVGYYHNAYKVPGADAMGVSINRRGFSDAYLYVSYNNQSKVTLSKVEGRCKRLYKCTNYLHKTTGCEKFFCPQFEHRVSYAIPLEIVYTTPLQTWNPYKLVHQKDINKPVNEKILNKKYRNGGLTRERAYYGTSNKYYYLTPAEFYEKSKLGGKTDRADTVRRNDVGVLDAAGSVRNMVQSGISIMTKEIPDVGKMRIRYPIMPIHDFGNVIYKELSALSDMALKKSRYEKLYPDVRYDNGTIEEVFEFETRVSTTTPPSLHIHTLELTLSQINYLKTGKYLKVDTTINSGHSHTIEIAYNTKWNTLNIRKCDDKKTKAWKCWDGHYGKLYCPDCRLGTPVN